MAQARQFALPFPQALHYAAAGFLQAPSNAAALAWLEQPQTWPGARLALHGPDGCGKTHLLHLFAELHHATFIPPADIRLQSPPTNTGALAIDDADTIANPMALLHLLNTAAEHHQPVLLAARTAPAHWPFALADLTSRLRAITAVAIGAPEDSLHQALLARLIAEHQLAVPPAIQQFLLLRLPRTGTALREAACRLDREALAQGGRVTRDTANRVMAGMGCSTDEDTVPANREVDRTLPKEALLFEKKAKTFANTVA